MNTRYFLTVFESIKPYLYNTCMRALVRVQHDPNLWNYVLAKYYFGRFMIISNGLMKER